jgi:hypothetical protein
MSSSPYRPLYETYKHASIVVLGDPTESKEEAAVNGPTHPITFRKYFTDNHWYHDVVAGVLVTVLLVPQSLSYAAIAQVNSEHTSSS